jgi:hypothetical protein
MARFASDKNVIGECDVCGFQYKLRELRGLVVNSILTSTKACPTCWNPDHPQNSLGKYPVNDPQAIKDPRPDFAGYAQSRAQIIPVPHSTSLGQPPIVGTGFLGSVVVSTS